MSTVKLSPTTYQWLQRKARESAQTPDQVADALLRQHLAPQHPYIEVVAKSTGLQAMLKGSRIPVSIIIGYLRMGETPESQVVRVIILLNEPTEREDEEAWARLTAEQFFAEYSEADAIYGWRGETIFMQHLPSTLLEEITKRLVQGLHPEQIILFGSHAYGQPSEASDIDLLVIVADSHEPRHRRVRQAYTCLRGLTAPTEVLVLTRREIAQSATVPTSFVSQALQCGRVLYG